MPVNTREEQLEQLRRMEYQEEADRVSAVHHIQVEHFSSHTKIEGYYENLDAGHMFGCDRLMKAESMFGRLQLGYNPNRKRSFIFVNLKTSRYDTVSSRYQREMKEYQMKSLLKGENQNRAFLSKRMSESSVLFEKADTKPWSEDTVRPYYARVNVEALSKTMPYLARGKNRERLEELRKEGKSLQVEIQQNINEGRFTDNIFLRQRQIQRQTEENFLENLLQRKAAASRYFMRKINYAFDIQKHEMFEYYKNKQKEKEQAEEAVNASGEDDNKEEM